MKLLLAVALVVAGPQAAAWSLADAGTMSLAGRVGGTVERRLVLDLWDAADGDLVYHLRDRSEAPGVRMEARLHPLHGRPSGWLPPTADGWTFRVSSDGLATAGGWDGQYLLALRFHLDEPGAAESLLLWSLQHGSDALLVRTVLSAEGLQAAPVPARSPPQTCAEACQELRETPTEPVPISLVFVGLAACFLWSRVTLKKRPPMGKPGGPCTRPKSASR